MGVQPNASPSLEEGQGAGLPQDMADILACCSELQLFFL